MKNTLTQSRLKEVLCYNPDTGVFTRNKTLCGRAMKGNPAGTINSRGYIQIKIDHKHYKAHRLAFLYMEGYFPENDVDHIDRNPGNNKWENLREVSRSCNQRNCTIAKNNTSGVTGVYKHKSGRKWLASIRVPKKQIFIGYFNTKIDAAKARWEAEVRYNFPNCNTTSSAYEYIQKHTYNQETPHLLNNGE